jgi:hypothetical protein
MIAVLPLPASHHRSVSHPFLKFRSERLLMNSDRQVGPIQKRLSEAPSSFRQVLVSSTNVPQIMNSNSSTQTHSQHGANPQFPVRTSLATAPPWIDSETTVRFLRRYVIEN